MHAAPYCKGVCTDEPHSQTASISYVYKGGRMGNDKNWKISVPQINTNADLSRAPENERMKLLFSLNVAISRTSELPPHRMGLLPLVSAKIATFQLYAVTLLSGPYRCAYCYLSVATETTSGGFCSFPQCVSPTFVCVYTRTSSLYSLCIILF